MSCLIDTNVAIRLRDGDRAVQDWFDNLDRPPFLSMISWVELEGGVMAKPPLAARRRLALDAILQFLTVLDFDADCVAAYRRIVERTGFNRRKVIDRMIAATALMHDLPLATGNERDFRDIRGLRIEALSAI